MLAVESLMSIVVDARVECFVVETHASWSFFETTNLVTFTDEDIKVEYPDHRRPLYLTTTINDIQIRRALVKHEGLS